MKIAKRRGKLLLWLHLFVCFVWLNVIRSSEEIPTLYIHVLVWSILGIQFTWGYTVGLIVGPSRERRKDLWWSLLTVFMPLYVIGHVLFIIALVEGPLIAAAYLAVFTMVLASETFCGVMLGSKHHWRLRRRCGEA